MLSYVYYYFDSNIHYSYQFYWLMNKIKYLIAFKEDLTIYFKSKGILFDVSRVIEKLQQNIEVDDILSSQKVFVQMKGHNVLERILNSQEFRNLYSKHKERLGLIQCPTFRDIQKIFQRLGMKFLQSNQDYRRRREEQQAQRINQTVKKGERLKQLLKPINSKYDLSHLQGAIVNNQEQFQSQELYKLGQQMTMNQFTKLQKILLHEQIQMLRSSFRTLKNKQLFGKLEELGRQLEQLRRQNDRINQELQQLKKKLDQEKNSSYCQSHVQNLQDPSHLQVRDWYKLWVSPNNIQLKSHQTSAQFNQLKHSNTFHLIKYVCRQQEINFIAKHKCKTTFINPGQTFLVQVQLGEDEKYIRGDKDARVMGTIRVMGPKFILKWITDIASGIAELQDLGIYHADLFFRNTIRVRKGQTYCFKIIDLDKAFKVIITQKGEGVKDKSYESTKNLLVFWLNANQGQQEIMRHIFYDADHKLTKKLYTIKDGSLLLNQKVDQCIDLLREHMRASHLKQYSKLVEQLITANLQGQLSSQILSQPTKEKIISALERLNKEKINYLQFVKQVAELGEGQTNKQETNKQ